MSDQPMLPTPLDDPRREGIDVSYWRVLEANERGGFQGKQREKKGLTLKQQWYRELAIRRQKQKESDNDRPNN